MIEAYPLCWPVGQKRTSFPQRSRFGDHTLSKATKEVLLEIERMGGKDPIISSNIPLRKDGMPRSDYEKRMVFDKGCAVYFMRNKKQVVLACDSWNCIEDNLWAIACSISAMRSLGRWGVSEILERAFSGFTAIPERASGKNCWDVLGIRQTANTVLIKTMYKQLAKERHPDGGGNTEAFQELNEAYDQAMKAAKSLV
jgi:hypothetical protein